MFAVPRTSAEVREIILRFLDGDGTAPDPWAWDDFISVPIKDYFLDAVRRVCDGCPNQFPPPAGSQYYCGQAGYDLMRFIALQLPE